jgi:hypothetical protein
MIIRLRSVCLLVDGKVGIKKNDLIAVEMLEEMDAPFHVRFCSFILYSFVLLALVNMYILCAIKFSSYTNDLDHTNVCCHHSYGTWFSLDIGLMST